MINTVRRRLFADAGNRWPLLKLLSHRQHETDYTWKRSLTHTRFSYIGHYDGEKRVKILLCGVMVNEQNNCCNSYNAVAYTFRRNFSSNKIEITQLLQITCHAETSAPGELQRRLPFAVRLAENYDMT